MTSTGRHEPLDEGAVTDHYAGVGLRGRIEAAIASLDGAVDVDTLGPLDEFHVGGRPATVHLADRLGLAEGQHVLDLGSGLGGTARLLATRGAVVHGVDLTPEYVEIARWLTDLVGLSRTVTFEVGSITDLRAPDQPFHAATMLHVGMNIADKPALAESVHRSLGAGARFAIYDLMRTDLDGELTYPVPWAASAGTSALDTPGLYSQALESAGFIVELVEDRTDAALAFFDRAAANPPATPPVLGLHLIMGSDTGTRIANMVAALRAGLLAPTLIIARA